MFTRAPFLLILFCLGHFMVDFMWGVWPFFKTQQGLDLAYAGLVGGIGAFVAEFSQVFFGGWSDRGNRFLITALGLSLSMAMAWISSGGGPLGYGLIYLTFALGSAAFHPSAAGGIATLFPQSRSFVLSVFWMAGSLGLASSQFAFSYIHQKFEGETSILAWMAAPLVVMALWLQKKQIFERKEGGMGVTLKQVFRYFKREDTRLLWFFHLAMTSIYWGTIFYLPDVLTEKGCSQWICGGMGHLFFILGATLMLLPAGWLGDRFSPRSVLQVAVGGGFIFYFTLMFSPSLPPSLFLPLLMGVGATLGVVTPLTISWGNRIAPDSPGLISAFLMGFVWFLSELIGMTGVGLLSKLFTSHAATQSLIVLGSLFMLGSFSLYRLGRREEIQPA